MIIQEYGSKMSSTKREPLYVRLNVLNIENECDISGMHSVEEPWYRGHFGNFAPKILDIIASGVLSCHRCFPNEVVQHSWCVQIKHFNSSGIDPYALMKVDKYFIRSRGWFNIKISSYQYRKSHCGDKTVVRSSYLHTGISYTGKMISLYWIRAQVFELNR